MTEIEEQYNKILTEHHATSFSECRCLRYAFPSVASQHAFHFSIMSKGLKYFIYDGTESRACIVVSKDADYLLFDHSAIENNGDPIR